MKKRNMIVVGIVLAVSLLAAGSAFARRGDGYGTRSGDGYNCWRDTDRTAVDVEAVTKFRKETLPLRDELLTKRLDLGQEYSKENPDTDRITKLRKEMVDIEVNIDKIAEKYDLEGYGQGRHHRGAYGGGFGDCPGGRF